MSTAIGNLLPSAVVAAVVAWCCYPYLDEPGSDAGFQQEAGPPQIVGALLSPVIESASDRDPFKPRGENGTDSAGNEQPGIAALAGKSPPRKEDAFDVSSNLMLAATYIQGNRRVALINGQVCEPGDTLRISGPITEPCTVTRIFADTVVLLHRNQIVELKYRDSIGKTKPSKPSEPRHE